MKKRILLIAMALFVSASSMPLQINAAENNFHHYDSHYNDDDYNWYDHSYWYDDDDDDWYYDNSGDWYYNDDTDTEDDFYDDNDNWYDDDDDDRYDSWYDDEMTVYDLAVNPSKKRIRAGKNFYLEVVPAIGSGWEDLSEEEWNEICEDNIESIEYHSMRSRVASVNKFTGKVKAKKKGSAVIKTKITLVNDESIIFKTKVIVTK